MSPKSKSAPAKVAKRSGAEKGGLSVETLLRSINVVFDVAEPSRVAHFRPTGKSVSLLRALLGLQGAEERHTLARGSEVRDARRLRDIEHHIDRAEQGLDREPALLSSAAVRDLCGSRLGLRRHASPPCSPRAQPSQSQQTTSGAS